MNLGYHTDPAVSVIHSQLALKLGKWESSLPYHKYQAKFRLELKLIKRQLNQQQGVKNAAFATV